ncbi:MAG: PDZ domain-containing protein [Nitriliruptoraceae bacterium]
MGPVRTLARRALSVALVLAAIAAVVGFSNGMVPCEVLAAQPSCQVALEPGPVEDSLELITVSDATVFPPEEGSLRLTTVAVQEQLGLVSWVRAHASGAVEVVPREQLYPPGVDREEIAERNALSMRDSQQVATIVALERLGYDLEPAGALILSVEEDAVTDELEVDDVVVAVDDAPVRESTEAVEAIRAREPGDTVTLTVRAAQGERTVEVVLGPNPLDPTLPYVGVLLTTDVDLPVDIAVDAGVIGGPSAGLIFALSLLELLEPEPLLGELAVAGTGTLARDGSVGSVGGVTQKVVGATDPQDGSPPAEVFLVPQDDLDDALEAPVRTDILIVPVGSLEDALEALELLRSGRTPADGVVLAAS